jgi:hypothetical protein
MCARTRLNADEAGRQRREELQQLRPANALADHYRPIGVHAVNLKNRLRDIETDRANLAMDGSPQVVRFDATTLWHFDAAGWAPSTASKADIRRCLLNVRFAPKADIRLRRIQTAIDIRPLVLYGPRLVVFFSAISQCRAALFDQRLKLGSHFLASSALSREILLQAVYVIDPRADLRERACIACARPQVGQEISGNKTERERDKGD